MFYLTEPSEKLESCHFVLVQGSKFFGYEMIPTFGDRITCLAKISQN